MHATFHLKEGNSNKFNLIKKKMHVADNYTGKIVEKAFLQRVDQ